MMMEIQQYMDSNRLKLNAEKTKIMVMTTKQKDVHKDLKVFLKGVEVERVNFAKFLGIIISGNLKWNEYILQSENSPLKFCNKSTWPGDQQDHILHQLLGIMSRLPEEESAGGDE